MSREIDLDSLKSAWQQTGSDRNYSEGEIFSMLKRKSLNAVKWVYYISLAEITLAVLVYIYFFARIGISDYHQELVKEYGSVAYIFEILNFIVYAGTAWFIYRFFRGYRRIKVQSSVRELSNDIVQFRKVVRNFIQFNLVMFLLTSLIVINATLNNSLELKIEDMTLGRQIMVYGISLVPLALLGGLVWLYYYLVYGTFQRRLKRNLMALDEMD